MKIKKARTKILEGDLTPMIDMTFLLIAFFMLIINFSETEKDQDLELPDSKVARTPDEPPKYQIVMNLRASKDGTARVNFVGKNFASISAIGTELELEKRSAAAQKVPPAEISVIIRADRYIAFSKVQELMAKCQEYELQKFSLRAKENIR